MQSHLTRGAWIEIYICRSGDIEQMCRTSHEVRGLKLQHTVWNTFALHVAPHTRCVD